MVGYYRQRAAIEVGGKFKECDIIESRPKKKKKRKEFQE